MTRSGSEKTSEEALTQLAVTRETLEAALRGSISGATLMPVDGLVRDVLLKFHVDREEVVAVLWDLVEDDDLRYDAAARVSRAG